MGDQPIIFIVTLFIVIASVRAVEPLTPDVKCTKNQITVTTKDFSKYQNLVYESVSSGRVIKNINESLGLIEILSSDVKLDGDIFKFDFKLTKAALSSSADIVLTCNKTFRVECNPLIDGIGVVNSTIDPYQIVNITESEVSAEMTITPPMQIKMESIIIISIEGYKCATIDSCYIHSQTDVGADTSTMYKIYKHCAPLSDSIFIEKVKFDKSAGIISATLIGIGLPDTRDVAITCKVAGKKDATECVAFEEVYESC